jgi:hypothetical protein
MLPTHRMICEAHKPVTQKADIIRQWKILKVWRSCSQFNIHLHY